MSVPITAPWSFCNTSPSGEFSLTVGESGAAVAGDTARFPPSPEPAEALQHSEFPGKKKRIVVRKTPKLPGACQCHVFTALVNMLVLGNSRAARVSAEGVQQRGAAISHVKHILLTGTHYITSNDIILYSNWWSTLLFKKQNKQNKKKNTSILTRSRLLETFFFFHGTAELSHTCFDSQTSTNT